MVGNRTEIAGSRSDEAQPRQKEFRPDLISLAIFLSLFTASSCAEHSEPPRPSVVLISLDTTRADHIGAYGGVVQTPEIDRFAAESVLFENVSAACTTTLPSHVSLFTGQWPTHHGVVSNGYTVNKANRMLPEVFQEEGYTTAGFSAAIALSELLNFSQGFDRWDQDPEIFSNHIEANRMARRAGEITDAAIEYLGEGLRPEPFFLFLHYVDPHSPYDPPEPYRSLYGEISAEVIGNEATLRRARDKSARQQGELPREIDLKLASLYAGEVSYTDHEVGRFLRALQETGNYDDALIVITADHGETFWEHSDPWSHGFATYETTVSIPLIVRYPGGAHAGTRVNASVSNIDLMPTLLRFLEIDLPTPIDGEDLSPLLAGGRPDRGASFSQAPLPGGKFEQKARLWKNERKTHSVRMGRWKYTRSPRQKLEELYDLEADPGENENLLKTSPERVQQPHRKLAAALTKHLASASPLPSRFFPRAGPPHDPDAAARRTMRKQLKAMGYLSEEDEEEEGGLSESSEDSSM